MDNQHQDLLKKRDDNTLRQQEHATRVKSFTPPPSGISPIPVQKSTNPIQLMQELPIEERPDYFKPNFIQQMQALPKDERPEILRPNLIERIQRENLSLNKEVIQKKEDGNNASKKESTEEKTDNKTEEISNEEKKAKEQTKEILFNSHIEGEKLISKITERQTQKGVNGLGEDEITMSVKVILETQDLKSLSKYDPKTNIKPIPKHPPVTHKPKMVKKVEEKKPEPVQKDLTPEQINKMVERSTALILKKMREGKLNVFEKTELELYNKYLETRKPINSTYTVKKETLKAIFPNAKDEILDKVIPVFNKYLGQYGLINDERFALFLSQVGHESLGFQKTSVTESTYYKTVERLKEIFPKYFTGTNSKDAKDYIKNSKNLANLVYSNRMGNGDENSGDGYRYRGRGLMQLTGKTNYKEFTKFYNKTYNKNEDFVANPDKIADNVEFSILSALWYFNTYVINKKSYSYRKKRHKFDIDKEDIIGVTVLVNGGVNGLAERKEILNKAKQKLKK